MRSDTSTSQHLLSNVKVCDVRPQNEAVTNRIFDAIHEVITSGEFILGNNVRQLELEIAKYCGTQYAIGVANGTDALHLALRALRIGPGDEVITTPFTFVATSEAILMAGATPVFVDIDPLTLNIDHVLIEQAITPRTKAILPVHLYGYPCEIEEIVAIANRHSLYVIEDCAQAMGATYKGRRVGSFGTVACLSFFPTKNLGCMGDGGMVITNDPEISDRVEMLRRHGARRKYHHDELGLNSRLDELQAAILRAKLGQLDHWNDQRRRIAAVYDSTLTPYSMPIRRPKSETGRSHVYHQYTVLLEDRDAFADALRAQGIDSAVHYPTPLHLQPIHSKLQYAKGSFPVSEDAAARVLSLPIYPMMPDQIIRHVTRAVAIAADAVIALARRPCNS